MQSSGKLRKKLSVKSAQFEALKNECSKLLAEKLVLNEDYKKVKDELKLAIETIELLCEKNEISKEIRSLGIRGFGDELDRLAKKLDLLTGATFDSSSKVSDEAKEKMIESDVAFSSRFMPNVKFRVPISLYDRVTKLVKDTCRSTLYYGFCTDTEGNNIYPLVEESYNIETSTKEVNYLEAIPELVPKGMVYDKQSDSLHYISKEDIRNFMVFEDEDFVSDLYQEIHKQPKQKHDNIAFSSRFMPNVKFKVPKNLEGVALSNGNGSFQVIFKQCAVDKKGVLLSSIIDDAFYDSLDVEEVSIYEAIPGFVPKGMVYYPKRDVLVKKVCDNQMHQGEFCDCDDQISFDVYEKSIFCGKFPFSENQTKLVLDTFGLDQGEKLLELCVHHNINPDELI